MFANTLVTAGSNIFSPVARDVVERIKNPFLFFDIKYLTFSLPDLPKPSPLLFYSV